MKVKCSARDSIAEVLPKPKKKVPNSAWIQRATKVFIYSMHILSSFSACPMSTASSPGFAFPLSLPGYVENPNIWKDGAEDWIDYVSEATNHQSFVWIHKYMDPAWKAYFGVHVWMQCLKDINLLLLSLSKDYT